MIRVPGVWLKQGDHARRGRIHEGVSWLVDCCGPSEIGQVRPQGRAVLRLYFSDTTGPFIGRGAARFRLPFKEAGEGLQIRGRAAGAVARKAAEAMLDIVGIGYLAHLAIADDIDARVHLAFDHLIDRAGDHGIQGRFILQRAVFLRKHAIGHGL